MTPRCSPLLNKFIPFQLISPAGHPAGLSSSTGGRLVRSKDQSACWSRAVLIFSVTLVLAAFSTVRTGGATEQESKLVAVVIDAIKRNNSLVQSAQLTLRETRNDAGVA